MPGENKENEVKSREAKELGRDFIRFQKKKFEPEENESQEQ